MLFNLPERLANQYNRDTAALTLHAYIDLYIPFYHHYSLVYVHRLIHR